MLGRLRKGLKNSLDVQIGKKSCNSLVIFDKEPPKWAVSAESREDLMKNKSVFTYPKRLYERSLLFKLNEDSSVFSLASKAVNILNSKKLISADILIPKSMKDEKVIKLVNTAILSNYEFSLKTPEEPSKDNPEPKKEEKTLQTLFLERGISAPDELELSMASAYCSLYARDLANTRGSEATPAFMVEKAQEVFQSAPDKVSIEVISGNQLKENGLHLLYAVGKGAICPPHLVVLKYTGNDVNAPYTAIVGKGLTFDTGGLNLKPTNSIEEMYLDKSGACAALAAFRWAVETNFQVNLICTLALAENAIGSNSYKPLDIITSLKGKTVEIGNTDAEGRLCLADALTYTQTLHKPSKIIDLATLTGACVVALGEETAGGFGSPDLVSKLSRAGRFYQEEVWHLPINKEHERSIKGKVADLSNTGKNRYGGASTAAAFLKQFIEKDVEWAHLDIAGPAMNKSQRGQFSPGGTGFGVQLLTRYLIEENTKNKKNRNK
jgi:leucyl aminopeptidase